MKQKVVNFFPGPGAGKSTMASALFAELKFRGLSVELVQEYVKAGEWEGRTGKIRECQDYIFAKQHFRMRVLEGEVDYIITDAPLMLSLVYGDQNYLPSLSKVVREAHDRFNNFNFFVERTKDYVRKGRSQTPEQARDLDVRIAEMLNQQGISYMPVAYSRPSVQQIADFLTQRQA